MRWYKGLDNKGWINHKKLDIMDKKTGLWKLEEIEDGLTPHQKQSLIVVPICQKGGKIEWCDLPRKKGYI